MVVELKEKFEKTRHVENAFCTEKEMLDIMIEFFLD